MAGFVLYQHEPPGYNFLGIVAELPEVLNGLVFIYLPDGVQIDLDASSDAVSVAGQKDAALIAAYGSGYAFNRTDAMGSTAGIDSAWSGTRAGVSEALNIQLMPEDGAANPGQVTTVALAAGVTVNEAFIIWELREILYEDSYTAEVAVGDRAARKRAVMVDHDDVIVRVSCDNGVSWDVVTYGTPFVPTVPGTDIRVQFETKPGETRKITVGGYWIFYNGV